MNKETVPFISKIRQIPGALYQLDEAPLLGFPPVFSWEQLAQELGKSLQVKDISITPGQLQWFAETELFQGLGDRLKTLSLTVQPLAGPVWFVLSEQGLLDLMHLLLAKDVVNWTETIDDTISRAFYHFFATEVINAFEKTGFDKKLVPSVNKEATLPSEACLGIDIAFFVGKGTIHGRLLLSPSFRKSWMQHYMQEKAALALSSPLAESLSVVVHLEAGTINLKPSEWQQIHTGDFVILDKCSLDPDEDKGRVMLVINETPFFRGRIKNGSLKILEHPMYHEVNVAMEPPAKDHDDSLDDIDDDFDFDEDLSSLESDIDHTTGEHSTDEHTTMEQTDDHTLHSDSDMTLSEGATDHDHEGDLDISYADLTDFTQTPAAPAAKATKTTPTSAKKPTTIEEIPLNVIVEVGRIQLSVKKLLELQPGNMLDINAHSDGEVDLVVNGKRIARGELLKIGDSLGVRILELS